MSQLQSWTVSRMLSASVLCVFGIVGIAACGPSTDDHTPDAAVDIDGPDLDAGSRQDTGAHQETAVGPDLPAQSDAGPDATPDAAPDTPNDATAETDAAPDADALGETDTTPDPCAIDNGGCAQTCSNSPDGAVCSCDPGYTLAADGLACDDIDECATDNGGCAQTCTNEPGTFACTCDPGFTLGADGLACDDIDECATDNGGCAQTCTNEPGTFTCCAPELVLPPFIDCDGVLLTDPASIETQTDGITTTDGPTGGTSTLVGDGQSIDLLDEGCLQLGKDGTDFSLTMWLNATGSSQIIGTKSQYSGHQGFIVFTSVDDDDLLVLKVQSAIGPDESKRTLTSVPFNPGTWTHVAVTYRNQGDQSAFTVYINGEPRSDDAHPDVYNDQLRIGDEGWGQITPFEVSELRSWGRQLTELEARSLFFTHADVAGFSFDELGQALDSLAAHVDGTTPLDPTAFDFEVTRLLDHAPLLRRDPDLMVDALDLVTSYETLHGPLFLTEATLGGFPREGSLDDSDGLALARGMLAVQQAVLDHVFAAEVVAGCRAFIDGAAWLTADHFPGAAPPPADPTTAHSVTIRAEVAAHWGRPVAFATDPARRPTGLYLPPGTIGTVTVPPELVDAGYEVLVGDHTWDHHKKATHRRLDRVTRGFPILESVTHIANPLGGGVSILVPYLADHGLVDIHLTGVIEAPFFSLRSFDATTNAEWLVRRTAPGPWATFETDKFMMQVPSAWISAFDDPLPLMQTWDLAMDGISELLAYPPETRNRTVMYLQVDLQLPGGAHGIGYPQVNNLYNPQEVVDGWKDHWLLTDPTGWEIEFHETGHAQLMSMFSGENEAIVNFPHCYVRNVKFGVDLDTAFRQSLGPAYGDVGYTPDQAAIHWMLAENFRNGLPMDKTNSTKNEIRYQHRGYAKYADIARLFDWEVLRQFHLQENLDYMADTPDDGLENTDSRILRLSIAAGADLTPLIHFWGIHPVDPAALEAQIALHELPPSTEVYDQLLHYADIAPANNAEFKTHFDEVYPGMPEGGHPDYGVGWYNVWTDIWAEEHAAEVQAAIQALLDQYYPVGD